MSRFRGGGSRPRPRPGGARGGARGRGRPSGPGGFFGPRETGPVGPKVVELPPTISVMDLATRLNTPPAQVIKALLQKGVSSTINNLLEYDASSSIAEALGFSVSREGEVVIDVSAAAAKHAEDSVDH